MPTVVYGLTGLFCNVYVLSSKPEAFRTWKTMLFTLSPAGYALKSVIFSYARLDTSFIVGAVPKVMLIGVLFGDRLMNLIPITESGCRVILSLLIKIP